jgi:hypothetical protein
VLPKLDFPKFNGEHPKVCREKCEKYFSLYRTPFHLWVPFATINFTGNAEFWLQSYEASHTINSWVELCIAVDTKFGKDIYHHVMRDLLNLKQVGTVEDYLEKFEHIRHQVLLHNDKYDDVLFVNRSIDGLKPDIKSVIQLHRPRTVDAAASLALMQAEALEDSHKKMFTRHNRGYNKYSDKPSSSTTPSPGVLGTSPTVDGKQKGKTDARLQEFMTQRRKAGLCMKCGEKWSRGHQCPT